ncbi:MAG: RNA polymerase sigma factor [Phycisphaeraceae bacterium]
MDQQKQQLRIRFETLLREHHDMLLAYIRSHMGRAGSADDLFQKTMLEAWTHLDKYDPSLPAGPWLRGITRNVINSHRRDDARRWRRLEKLAAQRLEQHFEYIEDKAQMEFEEVLDALKDCMEQLDQRYSEPLKHSYWGGLSVKEAAIQTGLSFEACKKRLQRGREMLRQCLTGKEVLAPHEGGTS